MFRAAFPILLACLMTSTAYMIFHPEIPLLSEVDDVDIQCIRRGYPGACGNIWNTKVGDRGCLFLPCAHYASATQFHVDYPAGTVADGTKCAERKVCSTGVCVDIEGRPMPRQRSNRAYYKCLELGLPTKSGSSSKTVSKKPKRTG